tara:strand:+ start:153 stop:674 length:522 start_codon:yes stop_codon:yes gene_type:complete
MKQRLILEKQGEFKTVIVDGDKCLKGFTIVGSEHLTQMADETHAGVAAAKPAVKRVAKKAAGKKAVAVPAKKEEPEVEAKKEEPKVEAKKEEPTPEVTNEELADLGEAKVYTVKELTAMIKAAMVDNDKNMDNVQEMYAAIRGEKSDVKVKLNELTPEEQAQVPKYIEDSWEK